MRLGSDDRSIQLGYLCKLSKKLVKTDHLGQRAGSNSMDRQCLRLQISGIWDMYLAVLNLCLAVPHPIQIVDIDDSVEVSFELEVIKLRNYHETGDK